MELDSLPVETAAVYAFGKPSGTTVGSTLTETITIGKHSETLTFTETAAATASTPAQFQLGHSANSRAPTYSFVSQSNGDMVETITSSQSTMSLTFTGGTQLSGELQQITPSSGAPTFAFSTSASGATIVTETVTTKSGTHSYSLPTNAAALYSATATGETVTTVSGHEVTTTSYAKSGSADVLASINTAFIAQGTATTALDIEANVRIKLPVTAPSGTSFATVTPTGGPAGSYVEETVTHGSHSLSKLFYSASGGIYTQIAEGATIDVTGVAAQLSHVPTALLALI